MVPTIDEAKNPNLPIINVSLNSINVPTLLDSGSSINLISKCILDDLKIESNASCNIKVQNFNGEIVNLNSCINLKILIQSKVFSCNFYVLPQKLSDKYQIILGCPFLIGNKFKIDFDSKIFYNHEVSVSLLNFETAEFCNMCNNDSIPLYATQKFIIPPKSQSIIKIKARVDRKIDSENVLIEPHFKPKLEGLFIARTVAPPSHSYFINVINVNPEPLHINKNSCIASYECLHTASPENFCSVIDPPQLGEDFEFWGGDFDFSHLETEDKTRLLLFLNEYKDLFAQSVSDLEIGCDTLLHKVFLSDDLPVRQRHYKVPHHLKNELDRQINELLETGIITHSKSPYAAPVILVKKKNNTYRLCTDFRKLNLKTLPDSFPIPCINDLVDNLSGAKFFTTLDLCSGFFQMKIHPDHTYKTAFATEHGLYEWQRVPFGLKNSPNSFQRLMSIVLSGLKPFQIAVYLDDIIIASHSKETHFEKLKLVFDRLKQHNLKLKPDKCAFLKTKIKYLGFQISDGKVFPDNDNIASVQNFKIPNSRKDVRSFLGLTGFYRKFIDNYSKIALPLTNLTKESNTKFKWNPEAQTAFEILKSLLMQQPCLQLPNFDEPFFLCTDASKFALGAVLCQPDTNKFLHPIAYASRKLKHPEINYSTVEKEMLAVIFGVSHFKQYLYGKHFTIYCDQASLSYALQVKDPTSRIARWVMTLEQYDYKIIHKPGKLNVTADYLSRNVEEINNISIQTQFLPDLLDRIQIHQTQDSHCLKIIESLNSKSDMSKFPVIYFLKNDILYCTPKTHTRSNFSNPDKLVIPLTLIPEILSLCHDSPAVTHQGFSKTLNRVKMSFYWPCLYKHIKQYIKSCNSCNEKRAHKPAKLAPLQRVPVTTKPMQCVAIDALGPFPMSYQGNKYILVMSDYFTRYPEAFATPDIKSETVARVLEEFISRHGVPTQLITDRGSNFLSKSISEVYKLLKIEKHTTTAYHAQSDAVVERLNSTIINSLSHLVNESHNDWDRYLPFALLAHRTAVHTTTKFTPAFLLYGRELTLPHDILTQRPTFSYAENREYAHDMSVRLHNAFEIAYKNLNEAAEKQESRRDKVAKNKDINVGDNVYLFTPQLKQGLSRKFFKPNSGPFKVIKKTSPVNFLIQPTNGTGPNQHVHVDRLSKIQERPEFLTLSDERGNNPSKLPDKIETDVITPEELPQKKRSRVVYQSNPSIPIHTYYLRTRRN